MMEQIAQAWILVCGVCAILLITSKQKRYRFYGAVIGLVSQVAWFYSTLHHRQYGMFVLSIIYTGSWIRGIINNREVE